MIKLLRADFSRLFRSKIFWLCAVVMLLVSAGYLLWLSQTGDGGSEERFYIDAFAFALAPYTALFSAAFTVLFIGAEYSNRIIINKLVIGHTRTSIYLADLVACFTGSVIILAIWFLGMLPGVYLFNGFEMGVWGVLEYFVIAVGFTAVFCSVFVLTSTLAPNRVTALVIVIVVWFALMFVGNIIVDKLINIDLVNILVEADGKVTITAKAQARLMAFRMLSRIIPTGQAQLMALSAYGNFWMGDGTVSLGLGEFYTSSLPDIGLSLVMTAIITAVGIYFFRKKDLN